MESPRTNDEVLLYHPSKVSWAVAQFAAKPASVVARVYVYALVALLVGLFSAAFFWKVAVGIDAPGMLITSTPLVTVNAEGDGVVADLKAKNLQTISKGDLLFKLAPLLPAAGGGVGAAAKPTEARAYLAPIAGVVTGMQLSLAAVVRRGDPTLTLIPTAAPLEAEAQVPSAMVERIREGMEAKISVAGAAGGEVSAVGRVLEISPVLSESRRELMPFYKVRIELEDRSDDQRRRLLKIGQRVSVRFIASRERLLTLLANRILNRPSEGGTEP